MAKGKGTEHFHLEQEFQVIPKRLLLYIYLYIHCCAKVAGHLF